MQITTFKVSDPQYRQALQLRTDVLRTPLGLTFTEAELQKDEHDTHFGLFEIDTILACLTLSALADNKMKMRQVAVAAAMQGQGLGKQLVLASEAYAKANGYHLMFCHARKTAVPFYKSLGYEVVSEEFTEVNIPHYAMEKKLV